MMEQSAASPGMRVQVSARFVSNDELIADLALVAKSLDTERITREQYDLHGHYSSSTIHRRLGGWVLACERAGLGSGRPDLGHSDEDWMKNIYEVWRRNGKQPSYGAMRGSKFSPEGYAHRYGSWTNALAVFQSWIDEGDSDVEQDIPEQPAPSSQNSSRTPSLRLRYKVLQRDRFTCVACGASPAIMPEIVLHVDHKTAYSQGGMTSIENLQTLCSRCNLGKSDL